MLFALCFRDLNEENSPNISAPNTTSFTHMFIQQYQAPLNYLYVPRYNKMLEKDKYDLSGKSNVVFIWILWFMYSFFMNMMMINFIVAVVMTTYDRVLLLQRIIAFKQ